MLVQILCDNPNSWIVPYAFKLTSLIKKMGNEAIFHNNPDEIISGDILVLLSCEKLFERLNLNKHNLVVHESALPKGKGWSPLTWQVLEGNNSIPVTLIEATEKIDSGAIYEQCVIQLDGTELVDELRELQGSTTISLVVNFVENYPNNIAKEQAGESSFYPKRTPRDSQLDINLSIAEQFNLLRVSDNERYPAWFEMNGNKYLLKIYRK